MKYVYVLRNRKISAYNDPFIDVQDKASVVKGIQRYCILEKDSAKKNHYDESELYLMGTYDDEKGEYDLLPQKEFLVDLGQYFEK